MTPEQTDAHLEVLLVEKQLHHAEKLSVIQAIKQSYAILGVVVGLLMAAAYGDNVRQAHLVVPYALVIYLMFLTSSAVVLRLIGQHLRRIDDAISQRVTGLPRLWQQAEGLELANWRPVLRVGAFNGIDPYFALAVVMSVLGLGMAAGSLVESWLLLDAEFGRLAANLYVGVTASLMVGSLVAVAPVLVSGGGESARTRHEDQEAESV